ncbi:hypothetical protein H8959_015434 [Pygathrix nigripes]
MHERKRQREEEIEAQEKAKREREWQKNFEESRDGRVDSWRNFQANTKGKKEKKNRTFLRPPKVKMEQRETTILLFSHINCFVFSLLDAFDLRFFM